MPQPAPADLSSAEGLDALWSRALEPTSPRKLRSILAGLKPVSCASDRITAALIEPVGNLVETNRRSLDELLSSLAGRAVHLDLAPAPQAETTADHTPTAGLAAGPDSDRPPAQPAPVATPQAVADDPLVARVVELFGARSIRVAPKRPADTSNP